MTFVRAFVTAVPQYRLEVTTVPEKARLRPGGNYGYRGTGEGTPPLFGQPGRYRVLAALAIHGTLSRAEVLSAAKATPTTLDTLVKTGWVRSKRAARANVARVALTIGNVAGREHLVPLLKCMAERWPPIAIPAAKDQPHDPGPPAHIPLDRYFGSHTRSEVLLTVAAMGQADIQMVHRAIHQHDRHEVVRALGTYEAFGILRHCRLDGRDHAGFELNSDWFAAAELRALLEALLEHDGRYRARARGALAVMPPLRQKRKTNAQKREQRRKSI